MNSAEIERTSIIGFHSLLPAFFNIPSMTKSAEFLCCGIHDDVAERHADHVVIVDGADANTVQASQSHHQVLAADREATGVLPVLLVNNRQQIQADLMFLLFYKSI